MSNNKVDIIVGTSGYSFDDWEGVFYPQGLEKGKRLDFYKEHFKATEINSTYYRIPHPAVFYNIAKKVGADFEFTVKTHRGYTHDRKDIENSSKQFMEAIRPLTDAGKLTGLVAQFPFSFKYSPANLQYIVDGKGLFGETPLFVEFRHKSWDRQEVYRDLKENNLGICIVDEPQLPNLFPFKLETTTNIGYIRLHGRNEKNWWGAEGDRYDYNYSEHELREIKNKIEDLKTRTDKIYLFFNNCHLGQAVRNAKMFIELMQAELK